MNDSRSPMPGRNWQLHAHGESRGCKQMLRKCMLAAFFLFAIPATPVVVGETAQASDLDRVGLIKQTWDGVAIKGYDPVAYFERDRALKGAEEYRYEWLGQEWHFISARHRDLFAENPIRYVPQYGGYCSESHDVADIDPAAWRIIDNRLYLFFSERSAREFASDQRAQSTAEQYWRDVKNGLAE